MNNRLTWRSIRQALRTGRPAAPQPRPAAAFWEAFNAHAPLHPQQMPEKTPGALFFPAGWLAGGGVAAAAAIAAGIYLFGSANGVSASNSEVHAYSVGVEHQAIVLLTDRPAHATILWVVGMESGKGEL
jgi:hypothetical protein